MNDFMTVSRTLIKRGWSDIEPKVTFALISGGAAQGLLFVLNAYGVNVPQEIQPLIPYACAVLGGYLTPSVGTTIVHPNDDNRTVVEQHTGNVETTFTAPTAIQVPHRDGHVDGPVPAQPSVPQSFTSVLNENAPTSMYPPSERAANIMQQLGNRTGNLFPADPNATERLDPNELH